MENFVEVDVRGLSCPEPVLLTMDAMQDHPGKLIRVLGDEAHTQEHRKDARIRKKELCDDRSPGRLLRDHV